MNTTAPASPAPLTAPYWAVFWDQWVRYFVTRDANFDSLSLDPQNPGPWAGRIQELTRLQDINSTDLSAFQKRGGKLLMAHGTADVLVSTRATAQYYERLVQTMGADTVKSFARYYEVPGYGHAASTAFNANWDSLKALDQWVSIGTAPAGRGDRHRWRAGPHPPPVRVPGLAALRRHGRRQQGGELQLRGSIIRKLSNR